MTAESIIWISSLAYVFSAIGLLRGMISVQKTYPPAERNGRALTLALAFGWPVWLPLVLVAFLIVTIANGVWEVL